MKVDEQEQAYLELLESSIPWRYKAKVWLVGHTMWVFWAGVVVAGVASYWLPKLAVLLRGGK